MSLPLAIFWDKKRVQVVWLEPCECEGVGRVAPLGGEIGLKYGLVVSAAVFREDRFSNIRLWDRLAYQPGCLYTVLEYPSALQKISAY